MNIVNNIKVYGLEESIVASGYPMKKEYDPEKINALKVTEKDLARAKKLARVPAGSGHDCFLKGIVVQFDLTLSEKVWPEFQRYTFADIVSSMSTVHMITKMNTKFYKYTDKKVIEAFTKVVDRYNENPTRENLLPVLYSYPSGLLLTARITTNYLQLKTIDSQRKNHILPEWSAFRKEIHKLPYFEEWCTEGELDDSEN